MLYKELLCYSFPTHISSKDSLSQSHDIMGVLLKILSGFLNLMRSPGTSMENTSLLLLTSINNSSILRI